jgi:hypothetical protein
MQEAPQAANSRVARLQLRTENLETTKDYNYSSLG